jgi:hypothetical protein
MFLNRNIAFCIFLGLLLLFAPRLSFSQQNDFQLWSAAVLNLEVLDNLKVHVEEELRLKENCSQFSRQINDIGISYRFNKHFKAGVFYRIEADWKNADEYVWRNGIYSDFAFRADVKRWTVGYRVRVQSRKVEMNDAEGVLFDGFRHRHKFSAEYDVSGIPLVPFIESELFFDYSSERAELRGLRSWIGMDYSFKRKHRFTLKYGVDQEIHTSDPVRAYIVALGYTLDISLH